MDNSIYKQMIQDSPLVYLTIDLIKDCNNKYIDAIIIDGNNDFNLMIGNNLESFKGSLLSDVMSSCEFEKLDLDKDFKYAISNKKNTSLSYAKGLNKYFNSEIYNIEDDKFIIRITDLDYNHYNFSVILRNSPFILWIKDRDGVYIDANKKFSEKCGKSYDEIIGSNDIYLWGETQHAIYTKQDQDVMHYKKMCHFQENITSIHAPDTNNLKFYDTTKWPYIDSNNNILGTIGISIEIIDKIELRENLKKNEDAFEEIAMHSEEVFIIANKEKALYVSPSFHKIFGEGPNKIYQDYSRWIEYYHPEDIEDIISSNINFENPSEFIKRINPINKEDKWVWVKGLPIKDERGNVIKKIIIISDITKNKKLELELENLRMDFFANISHELRTPLNVVFSAVQFLKLKSDLFTEFEMDYVNKYLNIIDQNGLRLLKLVNNLIDSTKIDTGYLEYNAQNFDIINFIENICMSVCDFAQQYKIELIFDTSIEEKIISFDLDMMERIMLNLLSNAIKFNEENGKIKVCITCDDYINISVHDSGVGIEQDKLSSIFGRFEQVKNKKNHNKEGSGIGLALVKSLVEMHGGKIKLESEINRGSKFTVSIPDTILKGESVNLNSNFYMDNKVNRMNVEFSDIYF